MNALYRGAVLTAAVIGSLSCNGYDAPSTPNPPNGASINASVTSVFAPNIVSVAQGATVTWVFGAVEHNVTFTAATGVPANITNSMNTQVARTFGTAGTYNYQCTIHAGMTGSVSVLGGTPGGY
ncbi:MAG TPA: plastocyanin/azurin family copper-binding protein [Gemmatimonadaceae bacterium]|nr:plastocyanin/azurin family copper-binding protein [Gemmatimonadaceae bacterium]